MLLNNAGFSMRGNTSLFETCAVKFSEPLELERIEPIIRNSGKKVLRARELSILSEKAAARFNIQMEC